MGGYVNKIREQMNHQFPKLGITTNQWILNKDEYGEAQLVSVQVLGGRM